MPRSSRMRAISVDQLGLLALGEAGRRLVEQQQLRLGRERARDLDAALVAVGEGRRIALPLVLGDADEAQALAGDVADARFLAPLRRQAQDRADGAGARCGNAAPT